MSWHQLNTHFFSFPSINTNNQIIHQLKVISMYTLNKIQLLAEPSLYLQMSPFKSFFPSFSRCLMWISLSHNGGGNFTQLPYCWRKSKVAVKVALFYNYSLLLRHELLPSLTLFFSVFSSLSAMHNCSWGCSCHSHGNRKTWSCSGSCHLNGHLFSYLHWNCAVF
ncbi:hypothetical protein L873DRAFT_370762 [Choiromyces venosus 120613-1]|uniref:Uncharacterized protein n=1 Tax=Choiromyces venosus 120613-1 TaxID=1336337 RepID=A0A3N4J2X0_9PEZI|nr:hypothetical protein L873DRAFT_370762 [Choiromyces venosus 120613-1]